MREVSCFAMSADGAHLAVGDGPELLVYLATGQPVWKHFCDGILIDIAYASGHLCTVDTEGKVVFHRAADGRVMQEVQLEGVMKGSMVSPDGLFAVITSGGVVVVQPNGETFGYPYADLNAGCYGPDRNSLGLGTSSGNFSAVDGTNGMPWGTIQVGQSVQAACWNPRGFWMFTAGTTLYCCDGGGTEILHQVDVEGAATFVVVTADGAIAAVLTPPGRIVLVELQQYRVVGHVVVRREVYGLAMANAKLGIGLDDGDVSTVDLISRATIRNEPHPGRGRNNWNLDLAYDVANLAGAITNLRAGGQAIAIATHMADDEGPAGGRGGCYGVGCLVFNVLMMTCMGVIGLAVMIKYFQLI